MEKISKMVAGYASTLLFGLVVVGCSSIAQTGQSVGEGLSALNPFKQNQEESAVVPAQPEQVAPTAKPVSDEAPKASIRVDAAPNATPAHKSNMEVNLGDNKQCTTFCALPPRKKPAQ